MLQRSRGVLMNLDKIRANFTNPVFFGGQTLRYKKTLTKVILTTVSSESIPVLQNEYTCLWMLISLCLGFYLLIRMWTD